MIVLEVRPIPDNNNGHTVHLGMVLLVAKLKDLEQI
jgi:hypothetical protein